MVFVVPALVLAMSACSSGGGPNVETVDEPARVGAAESTAPSPTATPTLEAESADVAAKKYLEAYASGDATKMALMAELSEPGSAAHTYALHQRAFAEAIRAEGSANDPQSVTVDGNRISLCGMGEEPECGVYANFTAVPSGKLASFTVNDLPIESRLLPHSDRAPVSVGGVEVKLISAYRTAQSDTLIMTLRATNSTASEVTVAAYDATYVSAAGEQVKPVGYVGSSDLQAGATTSLAIAFEATDPGGVLSLEVFETENFDEIGTLRVPIK